jgi:hypothetical protein
LPESIEQKIIADLKKGGFSLEIWAAAELKKQGWGVSHQEYYEDSESKPKTSDLGATKASGRRGQIPDHLTIKLVVECKQVGKNEPKDGKGEKEERPWVFYVENNVPSRDTQLTALEQLKYVQVGQTPPQVSDVLCRSHLIRDKPRYSVMALEAFSGGWNTTTYEGISQAGKAAIYFKKEVERMVSVANPEEIEKGLFILYPIVVFDGPMFELTIDEKGDFAVARSDHVIHSWEFGDSRFFIDIVTKNYFPKLIQEISVEIYPD